MHAFFRTGLTPLMLLSLAPGAWAQQDAGDFFDLGDADGNGELTESEYAKVNVGFTWLEVAGGDAALNGSDYAAAWQSSVGDAPSGLSFLDNDDSGTVSREEYSQGGLDFSFEEVDINGDGMINDPELGLAQARLSLAQAGSPQEREPTAAETEKAREVEQALSLEARVRSDPRQFTGTSVQTDGGGELGVLRRIVEGREDQQLFAVLVAEGEELVAVPLTALEWRDGALHHPAGDATGRRREYDPSLYTPLALPQTDSRTEQWPRNLLELAQQQPGAFAGGAIVDAEGRAIGTIDRVAMRKNPAVLNAIIASSAYPDKGDKLAVAITDLRRQGASLALPAPDAISAYQEEDFVRVADVKIPVAAEDDQARGR